MIKNKQYYVLRDKVRDDWVCTCRGIIFTIGDMEVVKRSHSSDGGITHNMMYHIKNNLGFDLQDDFANWCEYHNILHNNKSDWKAGRATTLDYGRSSLFALILETLRKPELLNGKKQSEYWKLPTPNDYINHLSKMVDINELFRLSKEAYKNNWTAISRYEVIPVTVKEDEV